jgi:Gpi18-like mannosyltransferase
MSEARSFVPRFWPLFAVALAVRLVVLLVGVLVAHQHPDAKPPESFIAVQYAEVDRAAAWPVEPWYRADALWILHVGTHGYANSAGPDGQHGAAFLPLLPAVIALASALGLNVYWVGVVAPNLAAAAGMAVFARLAAKITGDCATAIRAFVLLNAFPSALFFSAPYQESFGLLFTALALDAWYDGKSARAGLFAGVACLARLTGVTIGAAALAAWLIDGPRTRGGLFRALAVVTGCAVGVLVGWAVMWWTLGDPFAATKAHAAWGRLSPSPWNIPLAFQSVANPQSPQWFALGMVLFVSAGGVVAWVRRGTFWGLVALLPAVQLASTGTFLSGHRVMLAALPAFVELASLVRNRMAFAALVAAFALVQLVLVKTYVLWGFAG